MNASFRSVREKVQKVYYGVLLRASGNGVCIAVSTHIGCYLCHGVQRPRTCVSCDRELTSF